MQLAPSALHATVETLGGHLGWPVNELVLDDIVTLDGPRDRQIGMRLTGDGSNIQLWATGGDEPTDQEPTEGITPLPHGHRWNTWIHIGSLEADKDPATVLYNAITDRLMPVFDTKPLYVGHRPWAEHFDNALSEVLEEPVGADQPQPAPEPQAPAELPAKVVPMRQRRKPAAKADTPAADPKPRPARKRTTKPAADKPTAS